MGTVAFAVKAALFAALQADEALAAVPVTDTTNFDPQTDVTYGMNGTPDETPKISIELGEIIWDDEEPVALGNPRGSGRNETFNIVIVIQSHVEGDTQTDCNARMQALIQAVEAVVRPGQWPGVQNLISSGFFPLTVAEGADATGRGAIFIGRLNVKARI